MSGSFYRTPRASRLRELDCPQPYSRHLAANERRTIFGIVPQETVHFADTRLIRLCEWYYNADGADLGFDPEFPDSLDDRARIRTWNALHALNLTLCDGNQAYPEATRAAGR